MVVASCIDAGLPGTLDMLIIQVISWATLVLFDFVLLPISQDKQVSGLLALPRFDRSQFSVWIQLERAISVSGFRSHPETFSSSFVHLVRHTDWMECIWVSEFVKRRFLS